MTDDDDPVRRAELVRLGIARSGPARSGAAVSNRTDAAILQRLLLEHAELGKAQATLKPKRQKNQQDTTAKRLVERDKFVRAVDRERRKSDDVKPRAAVTAVLKKTGIRGVSWAQLSPIDRKKAVDAGVKRYRLAHAESPS